MTAKYGPSRSIPLGFDEELRFFTREVLRDFPSEDATTADPKAWLLEYGQKYFEAGGREAILAARAAAEPEESSSSGSAADAIKFPTAEELEEQLQALFIEADKDGNGVLDRKEFKALMKLFATELNVSVADLRQLMALADENDDGLIEYREFVPLATELLQMIYARMKHEASEAERQSRAVESSADFLMNGMSREDLEVTIEQIFTNADKDNSGYLDRKEFHSALRESDLGLTKKQIRMLMDEADLNGDGKIHYHEFVPLAFSLLVEMVAKQMEYEQLPADEAAAAEYLSSLFSEYDVDGTGRIHLATIKQAFRDSDIGLTTLQLRAILGLAVTDENGEVDYAAFGVKAASLISAIVAVQTDGDKAAKVVAARAGASALTVIGMDRIAFKSMLAGALAGVDAGAGRATLVDVRGILNGDLGMDAPTVGALLNLAREGGVDTDGTVDLSFISEYGFDTLAQLAQLEALATY